MTALPDRRLHAYRPDLAEERLQGIVDAERYTAGEPAVIRVPVAPMRPRPDTEAGIDTQLLFGEAVLVFDRQSGWCWVKSLVDGYVGYVPDDCLALEKGAPTHIISAVRTFVYVEPDMKSPALSALSMGSRLRITEETETRGTRYALIEDGGAIIAAHSRPIEMIEEPDYVAIAARFLEVPYLWGGRTAFGLDCSGLVQLSMMMAGKAAPRDSDMQAAGLGEPISRNVLSRGDLVFWKGHVAIMETPDTILHANGHTMTVAREGLTAAIDRIGWLYGQPNGYRRPV